MCKRETNPFDTFEDKLHGIAKQWTFQGEIGERKTVANPEGYRHWQARICLRKKKQLVGLKSLLEKSGFVDFHILPTVTSVFEGNNFNYVTKTDTREDGPWTDKEYTERKKTKTDAELKEKEKTWDIMDLEEEGIDLWHKQIIDWCVRQIDRATTRKRNNIINIVDFLGGLGKTTFVHFMKYYHNCCSITPYARKEQMDNDMVLNFIKEPDGKREIIQRPVVFMDLPRQEVLTNEQYKAIETVANGEITSSKWRGILKTAQRPLVIIFSNKIIDVSKFSPGRASIMFPTRNAENTGTMLVDWNGTKEHVQKNTKMWTDFREEKIAAGEWMGETNYDLDFVRDELEKQKQENSERLKKRKINSS